MSADKLNEAIQTFQAGDRDQARILFQEIISTDPNNDTAWYYYAALQDDPARRRAALVRVLEINPQHQRARDVLAAMDAAGAAGAASSSAPRPPATAKPVAPPPPAQPPEEPAKPKNESAGAGAAGFKLPVSIPGAPDRVTFSGLWSEWLELFLAGINVLMRKPGVYEAEIARGSWWRFWLLVGGVAIVSAVMYVVGGLFRGGLFFGLIGAILTLVLTPGITYAGVWLSDWWAKKQGSVVPQGQHALTAALPYVPAAVVSAVLGILPGIGGLLGFVVSIYAWYIMGLGFQAVHQFREQNQNWITLAFFVVGVILGGLVLGLIAGIVAAPFAIGAALF